MLICLFRILMHLQNFGLFWYILFDPSILLYESVNINIVHVLVNKRRIYINAQFTQFQEVDGHLICLVSVSQSLWSNSVSVQFTADHTVSVPYYDLICATSSIFLKNFLQLCPVVLTIYMLAHTRALAMYLLILPLL